MCNYREVGVIKADLAEYQSRILDPKYSDSMKLSFARICSEFRKELRRERDRLHTKKITKIKKAAKADCN